MRRLLLALWIALVAWIGWEVIRFPDVAALAKERPKTTAFIELRKKQLRAKGKSDEIEWTWVSYGRIAPSMRRAVLVAEDNAFYEHEGVDVEGMREALERNWKRKRLTAGGSTITQQLAKNLYLSPSRNPVRKIREYFIARSLEKHLTKKRILEIYLNVVELGERVYGVEAGARQHFHKSAAALSPREAALLAGCLPNPRMMNPASPNKRLRARQRMILRRMRRWGFEAERQILVERVEERERIEPITDTIDPTETTGSADSRQTTDTAETTTTTGTMPTTDTTGTTVTDPSDPRETTGTR